MPEAVEHLETAIDEIAGTDKWLQETSETGPALQAEHWNFKAATPENVELFSNVLAQGSPQLIQLFVQNGAPALEPGKHGAAPLVSAAGKGNANLVAHLIGNAAHLPAPLLFCALRAAARSGNVPTVRVLIDKGADINSSSCDNNPDPVLTAAAESANPAMVEEILALHPDVNAKGRSGNTALTNLLESSIAESEPEIVALLIEAGADVSARNDNGQTPIFAACNNYKTLAPLLAAHPDLNLIDKNGQTALMNCFEQNYIKALLQAGADPSIRNRDGRTAAQSALDQGAKDKAALLQAAAKPQPPND